MRSYSFVYSKSRLILSKIVDKYWNSNANLSPVYDINSSGFKENYEGYYSVLKEFKGKTNATIVVFIGPFLEDLIDPKIIQEELKANYTISSSTPTQESVIEMTKKLNINYIKIFSNDSSMFIPVDKHWNAKGNKMIADKLYFELNKIKNSMTSTQKYRAKRL